MVIDKEPRSFYLLQKIKGRPREARKQSETGGLMPSLPLPGLSAKYISYSSISWCTLNSGDGLGERDNYANDAGTMAADLGTETRSDSVWLIVDGV